MPDFDSAGLQANGWQFVAVSGPTSGRPTSALGTTPLLVGAKYYDTTVAAILAWDGANWRDETGTAR